MWLSQVHGIFILEIKFPSKYLPGQCDVQVRKFLMISLEDERSVVKQVLEQPNSIEYSVAPLFYN